MTAPERLVLRKKLLTALKHTRTMYGLVVVTGATEAEVGIVLNELHNSKIINAHSVRGFRPLVIVPPPQPFLGDDAWS